MIKQYHLYVKNECSYCHAAQNLLDKHDIQYTTAILDKNEELLNEVKDRYSWKTVPIILEFSQVEGVRLIGGYDDLCKHLGENIEN
tara:strand:- start:7 stop:264 length:258 start_codon:yes stop_codon:yes gene_type:complete